MFKEKYNGKEFYKKIIYPEQFKNDTYKLAFHVVNSCYSGKENKDKKKYLGITSTYSVSNRKVILDCISKILEKYDSSKENRFRYDCFTHIQDIIQPEDMYFIKSNNKRFVILKEYKFMLQRITKHIYRSENKKSVVVNNYFLKSDFKNTYKEKTTKSLCRNKLAHIFQVLQKYNYLHITYNSKNQRVIQIGQNNPFYMLKPVPDVEEQEVYTQTDRIISKLTSDNEMLQSAVNTLRQELSDANSEKSQLEGNVKELQEKNELLIKMVEERDRDIEQFATVPDCKVDNSFVTYTFKDYSHVISLN